LPGEGEAFFFHLRAGTTELAAPSFTPRFKLGVASGADAASGSAARSLAFSAAEADRSPDAPLPIFFPLPRRPGSAARFSAQANFFCSLLLFAFSRADPPNNCSEQPWSAQAGLGEMGTGAFGKRRREDTFARAAMLPPIVRSCDKECQRYRENRAGKSPTTDRFSTPGEGSGWGDLFCGIIIVPATHCRSETGR